MKFRVEDLLLLIGLSIKNMNGQSFSETSGVVECSQNIAVTQCPLENNNKFLRPQFIQIGTKKYIISNQNRMNWFAAAHRCRDYDAQLVNIENDEELSLLSKYLKSHGLDALLYWISANDLRKEGNFTLGDTGKAMAFADWKPGKPKNLENNDDCVHLAGALPRFVMSDADCHSTLEFICEEKLSNYDTLTNIRPPSKPFIKIGEKYYIITFQRMNWFKARDMCRKNNAQLANVQSEAERIDLARYIIEKGGEKFFWLSGNDLRQEGKWEWGDTGKTITYTKWIEGDPNNYYNVEHCMMLTKYKNEYSMIDTNCNLGGFPICVW